MESVFRTLPANSNLLKSPAEDVFNYIDRRNREFSFGELMDREMAKIAEKEAKMKKEKEKQQAIEKKRRKEERRKARRERRERRRLKKEKKKRKEEMLKNQKKDASKPELTNTNVSVGNASVGGAGVGAGAGAGHGSGVDTDPNTEYVDEFDLGNLSSNSGANKKKIIKKDSSSKVKVGRSKSILKNTHGLFLFFLFFPQN